ncbi:MAG: Bax inhibitor-1/YccA family protein, partial [Caulobacteraceae bacterium]
MSDFNRGYSRPAPTVADMGVDAGLRKFMLGVYNKVGLGLVLSAALAYVTGTVPAVQQYLFSVNPENGRVGYTLLGMVVAFAPLAILLFQTFMRRTSPQAAAFTYWAIVALIGASFGLLFVIYSDVSIFQTFLVTAASFGCLSLVGYTTKRDLTGMGSFLIMGLFGLLFAMLASLFFHSAALVFVINVVGVLIFAGLIAYDTQRLKMTYYQLG